MVNDKKKFRTKIDSSTMARIPKIKLLFLKVFLSNYSKLRTVSLSF